MALARVRVRINTTPVRQITNLAAAISSTSATSFSVDDATDIEANQNILVGSEEMTVTNIASNTLTVIRGVNGTTAATHIDNASVSEDYSPAYTPTNNPQIGTELTKSYDGVISRKTLGGSTFSVANYSTSRVARKLTYENLSESNKNRLVALFDYAKGQLNDFQYSDDGDTWYTVRFTTNKLPLSETAYNVYRVEIEIEEQL